ncbi:rod shape-determining protein MreD [Pseudooceanicola sp. CBS1P-1]|uniref:Rod shape-determining protein MreD n=1 Tax=Pseudooceanicola albus TaxID=2692189 RepID=A0A6L7G6I7_9RHOB|nr:MULTISPECIES: rod shape-determining protein MreD [Pseudooceanicola]MBT9384581.1 rod shape-determining protein MreD [Pseudooceanicola endophyticus]MXN18283.1 rod shape-determining protein MreD [Pseudooceanicola albus]
MADAIRASFARVWGLRLVYVALCLVIILFALLPLQTEPRLWVGPNLMLALTFAWALRRPELVPIPLVAVMFLLSDFLQMRPPGLLSALAVIATARLQGRARIMRERSILREWFSAGIAVLVVLFGYRVLLGVFFIDRPQLVVTLSEAVMTIAFLPVMVAFSSLFFGIRRAAVGEVDSLGHRL